MSLATIRARVAARADQMCQVLARTLAQGDTGASTPTWGPQGAPCACRVQDATRLPTEALTADQLRAVRRATLVFAYPLPGDVTITPERRIQVDGGAIYEVVDSDQGRAHPPEVRVDCLKVG